MPRQLLPHDLECGRHQQEFRTHVDRLLATILDHKNATPARVKELLPKFIDHVSWKKDKGKASGKVEVALFERPFRADRSRSIREIIEEIATPEPEHQKRRKRRREAKKGDPVENGDQKKGDMFETEYGLGSETLLSFNLDPEPAIRPFRILLRARWFQVCKKGRRTCQPGKPPEGPVTTRPIQAEAWRRIKRGRQRATPWERAERFQKLLKEGKYPSIRALARETGEDHSRVARLLKILDLPKPVLSLLRRHATNPMVRKHFSERRLNSILQKKQSSILKEIRRVAGA